MKIAYYKAGAGSWIDRLINRFSGNDGFSHVEIMFSDGMFFSSSPRDGGVRLKKIDPDCSHWEFLDIGYGAFGEQIVRRWAEAQCKLGLKYDWHGVIGFILPIPDSKNRRFCSEIVILAMQVLGEWAWLTAGNVSPNTLQMIHQAELRQEERMTT